MFLNTKQQEIEQGYQRYLLVANEDAHVEEGIDVTQSMRFPDE